MRINNKFNTSCETEGNPINIGHPTPCEIRKKYLMSLISGVEEEPDETILEEEEELEEFTTLVLCFGTQCESPFERGVGASVEGEFNNIKNRLISGKKRVDDFVKEYLDIINGAIKIASTMTLFNYVMKVGDEEEIHQMGDEEIHQMEMKKK
ncbi:hypothetical protein WDU94_000005 [Cyamophila willieti]